MIQYVIINEKERILFEKTHQVPYGYAKGIFCYNLMVVLSEYANIPRLEREDYLIEKIENGNTSVIYPENMRDKFVEVGE